jgi:hypothetical protein
LRLALIYIVNLNVSTGEVLRDLREQYQLDGASNVRCRLATLIWLIKVNASTFRFPVVDQSGWR